ncbi:MAG: hypothetical protein IPL78_27665 [Chloroflexi bacterium]|nr:hypothetical protein [Chloroflexota bacterium]
MNDSLSSTHDAPSSPVITWLKARWRWGLWLILALAVGRGRNRGHGLV